MLLSFIHINISVVRRIECKSYFFTSYVRLYADMTRNDIFF